MKREESSVARRDDDDNSCSHMKLLAQRLLYVLVPTKDNSAGFAMVILILTGKPTMVAAHKLLDCHDAVSMW